MWRSEKTEEGQDLVWDGVESGIAPSPLKGTANIQNANISTEMGEVMASFGRTAQQQAGITNGTLTPDGATLFNAPANLKAGTWISVSASTVTSINTTTSPTTVTADYLLVGGGGGGGYSNTSTGGGGGGGAGQYIASTNAFSVGTYAITVGAGGAGGGAANATAPTGSNSVIAGVATAYGGGGGGRNDNNGGAAVTGGSGGGGGGQQSSAFSGTGGAGATGGNNGGNGNATTDGSGGGGGGSGAVGGNASTSTGGNGGNGTINSITGTATFYAGGGGGGSSHPTGGGAGGNGGGGGGGEDAEAGSAATANTGGGGGGAGGNGFAGGAGGSGIAVISYPTGSMIAIGGNISYTNTNTVHTFTQNDIFTVVYIPQTNLYYVSYDSNGKVKLSAKFDPTGANALTHGTTGSVTFSTVAVPNSMIAKCVEKYTTATSVEYRYYMLDANSYVWVFDTSINRTYGTNWMLPDPNNYSVLGLTGVATLNGILIHTGIKFLYGKPTVNLGALLTVIDGSVMNESFPTGRKQAIQSNQGKVYYCDGNYIGEVFATTSLVTSIANIQSLCSYTSSTTQGTITSIIAGSLPYSPDGTRIPVVFFTDVYGTQPTNMTAGTVYYLSYNPNSGTFELYNTATGGSAKTLPTGAAGNQYFTTFWPFGTKSGNNGTTPLVQITTQRVNLPSNEVAQCLVELGNVVIIGGKTNILYPWNQIDATPSDFIALPENDVKVMINANNMAYVFAGNKGNIYVTNGSVASLGIKVPDYCAGVPGLPITYIEPQFTWGDADYIRGRVYFSVLDQTATKTGNCGGVWSFIPSQNMSSYDVGMSLRLENQNSYGDYDGYATIILPAVEQIGVAPQYWTAWQDSYSTATSTFGIDYTASTPVTKYVVETDLLPTGTLLSKNTYTQLEYKLSTPLTSTDSIQVFYRLNSTSAWTSCGNIILELDNPLSGYYEMAFQKTQWLQFRIEASTPGTSASSFNRFVQLRLR